MDFEALKLIDELSFLKSVLVYLIVYAILACFENYVRIESRPRPRSISACVFLFILHLLSAQIVGGNKLSSYLPMSTVGICVIILHGIVYHQLKVPHPCQPNLFTLLGNDNKLYTTIWGTTTADELEYQEAPRLCEFQISILQAWVCYLLEEIQERKHVCHARWMPTRISLWMFSQVVN